MAKKRYIKVPEAVILVTNEGEPVHDWSPPTKPGEEPKDNGVAPPITLADWTRRAVLEANPDFWTDYAAISTSNEIRAAMKVANGFVELDEDDWQKLEAAVKKPKYQFGQGTKDGYGYYRPDLCWQFQAFMDAICSASNIKPE